MSPDSPHWQTINPKFFFCIHNPAHTHCNKDPWQVLSHKYRNLCVGCLAPIPEHKKQAYNCFAYIYWPKASYPLLLKSDAPWGHIRPLQHPSSKITFLGVRNKVAYLSNPSSRTEHCPNKVWWRYLLLKKIITNSTARKGRHGLKIFFFGKRPLWGLSLQTQVPKNKCETWIRLSSWPSNHSILIGKSILELPKCLPTCMVSFEFWSCPNRSGCAIFKRFTKTVLLKWIRRPPKLLKGEDVGPFPIVKNANLCSDCNITSH